MNSCDQRLDHDRSAWDKEEHSNKSDAESFSHILGESVDQNQEPLSCSSLALIISLSFEPLRPSQWELLLSQICTTSGSVGHGSTRKAIESLQPHLAPGYSNALVDDDLFVLDTNVAELLASTGGEDKASERLHHAHSWLLKCCFEVMRELLHGDMCLLREPGRLMQDIDPELVRKHIPPVLRYACRYWASHASQSKLADFSVIMAFMKDHFLHWVEAITLSQHFDDAVNAIETCESLITKRAGTIPFGKSSASSNEIRSSSESALYRALEDFLYDARRFLCAHCNTINEAPLQLYYTAAYFTPKLSSLPALARVQYADVNKVQVSGTDLERWSFELFTLDATSPNKIIFSASGRWLAYQCFEIVYETERHRMTQSITMTRLAIWNARTGRRTHSQRMRAGRLTWFGFVGDATLAYESVPGLIELIDPRDGSLKGSFGSSRAEGGETPEGRSHDKISHIQPVLMGDDIAIASRDGIHVYDLANGKLKHVIGREYPRLERLGYTRGRLVVALADRADVWDPETGSLVSRHDFGFHAMSIWIEEGYLAATLDGVTRLWDVTDGTLVPLPYEKLPTVHCFTASEQYVVFVGRGKGGLYAFDTSTWERTLVECADTFAISRISCYRNQLIAVCSEARVALNGGWNWAVIDLTSGKHWRLSPSTRDGNDAISLTSASGLIALSCSTWTKICSIKRTECTTRVMTQIPSETRQQVVTILAGSDWGERVLTAHSDGNVALWELQHDCPRLRCRFNLPPYSIRPQLQRGLPFARQGCISQSKIALSYDGSVMAVSESHFLSVFENNDDTCRTVCQIQFEESSVSALSLSRDGQTLAALNAAGLVKVWKLRGDDGERQLRVDLETKIWPVNSFPALNGDGSLLAIIAQARLGAPDVTSVSTVAQSGSPYRVDFRRIGQAFDPDPASYGYFSPTQPRWLAISRNRSFIALGLRGSGTSLRDPHHSIRFVHIETGQLVFWTDDTSRLIGLEDPHDLAGLDFNVDETGVEVGGMRFEADTASDDATKLKPRGTPLPGTSGLEIPDQDRKWVLCGSKRLLCLPLEYRIGRMLTRRYGKYLVVAVGSKLLFVKHEEPSKG